MARLRTASGPHEIDARPSDALALAQRAGCPIFVTESILKQLAVPVPRDADDLAAHLGEGLASLRLSYSV